MKAIRGIYREKFHPSVKPRALRPAHRAGPGPEPRGTAARRPAAAEKQQLRRRPAGGMVAGPEGGTAERERGGGGGSEGRGKRAGFGVAPNAEAAE